MVFFAMTPVGLCVLSSWERDASMKSQLCMSQPLTSLTWLDDLPYCNSVYSSWTTCWWQIWFKGFHFFINSWSHPFEDRRHLKDFLFFSNNQRISTLVEPMQCLIKHNQNTSIMFWRAFSHWLFPQVTNSFKITHTHFALFIIIKPPVPESHKHGSNGRK